MAAIYQIEIAVWDAFWCNTGEGSCVLEFEGNIDEKSDRREKVIFDLFC